MPDQARLGQVDPSFSHFTYVRPLSTFCHSTSGILQSSTVLFYVESHSMFNNSTFDHSIFGHFMFSNLRLLLLRTVFFDETLSQAVLFQRLSGTGVSNLKITKGLIRTWGTTWS